MVHEACHAVAGPPLKHSKPWKDCMYPQLQESIKEIMVDELTDDELTDDE
jgi:hypothetical protein